MAEVLGKANLFPTGHYSQKKNLEGGACLVPKKISGFCLKTKSFSSLMLKSLASSSDFNGQRVDFLEKKNMNKRRFPQVPIKAQMKTGLISRGQKWWEKGLQPNMKEVTSAQELVDSLLNAGDKLVVVDFFSPGCGGCKALHPKICQFVEMNPDVQFLQVNYEEHKTMCYSLNVHVLPFFRFYRGAQGRVCSFSCTNATIKKFKDALAKHTPDRCSLGPTKGLEEKELLALSANKDLPFLYSPEPVQPTPVPMHEETFVPNQDSSHSTIKLPLSVPTTSLKQRESEEKTLVGAGR
ncbi:Thioredoxin-like 1-1 [Hibiscus syriacus]|uniref:Thioredoxin-like 1-1 n=1 Tax=Hibiscus syriacus TaxID=106335 RepID=A0A6A2WTR1_HIBSY|nr:thioredoxin-like 1-1, chloroplastic [Hibiscus syriacus]KAE8664713.1 Thioredoxin-like 1-1 [Hibiscus syriacus]